MGRARVLQILIRDVVVPMSGVALVFYLASLPGERFSLTVLAGAMMGVPFASRLDRKIRETQSSGTKPEDEEG